MMCKRSMSAAAIVAGLSITACGTDKTYIVEDDSPPQPAAATVVTPATPASSQVVEVRLSDAETRLVREYFVERDCPAGLVKQGNLCVAPGVVTERYVVGQQLPSNVTVYELPSELVTQLPALPNEYDYRIVDGDLVIVKTPSMIVLDADDLD